MGAMNSVHAKLGARSSTPVPRRVEDSAQGSLVTWGQCGNREDARHAVRHTQPLQMSLPLLQLRDAVPGG